MFRAGRAVYLATEPLISFYEAIMKPDWYRLESGQADAVWRDQRPTFLSRVVGPHFEYICRRFAEHAAPDVFGGSPGEALISFTEAEGADRHCEPAGLAIRGERIFGWLDQHVPAGAPAISGSDLTRGGGQELNG